MGAAGSRRGGRDEVRAIPGADTTVGSVRIFTVLFLLFIYCLVLFMTLMWVYAPPTAHNGLLVLMRRC